MWNDYETKEDPLRDEDRPRRMMIRYATAFWPGVQDRCIAVTYDDFWEIDPGDDLIPACPISVSCTCLVCYRLKNDT